MNSTNSQDCVIGIDVSKAALDSHLLPNESRARFDNTPEGHERLVAWAQVHRPQRIVLEASGGYEMPVAAALARAGLPVIVVNPRQVRRFAQALGVQAKTDRIDARVITLFAQAVRPDIRPLKDELTAELDAIVSRRRQLQDMLIAEQHRRTRAKGPVRKNIDAHIAWLERQLHNVDAEIGKLVREIVVYRAVCNRIDTLRAGQVRFEYRHASFTPCDILLGARLELVERPYREIIDRIHVCNFNRRASQPLAERSAGCVFKNPPGTSAGKLIDEIGLKGFRIGGAMVSDRHANFFLNRGPATCDGMHRPIGQVRSRIWSAFKIELEEEIVVWVN